MPIVIPKREVWTQQPAQPKSIDSALSMPSASLLAGSIVTVNGGTTLFPTLYSGATPYAGGFSLPSGGYVQFPTAAISITQPFTLVLRIRTGTSLTNQTILASSLATAGNRTIRILIVSATSIQFLLGDATGMWADDTQTINPTLATNSLYTMVVRYTRAPSLAKNITINRTKNNFTDDRGSYPLAPAALRFGKEESLAGYDFAGQILGYACIPRYMTDGEVSMVMDNPYRIVQP